MGDAWDDERVGRPAPAAAPGPDSDADTTEIGSTDPHDSGLVRSARVVERATVGTGRVLGRGGRFAFRGARRFTHADGAGESGLARLLEVHAFNTAGDAAVAVSLAGTLFFTAPSDEAVGQVALFLVITMLPFSVVAPLIGPFLDRFRRGRRWAIGATQALRAFFCWVLAGVVEDESATFFLAALGCLVASKAYGVTKAAAVPRLLPEQLTLVKANARVSLTGTAAGAISGPLAIGAVAIGPEWSLRYAAAIFAIGTILAILLPARVDSSEGEEQVDLLGVGKGRKITVPRDVVNALRCNTAFRLLSGFMTIFMAFSLREPPESMNWAWDGTILMGLVIGMAGVGNTIGTVIGGWTQGKAPQVVVFAMLVVDVVVIVVVSVFLSWPTAAALGLTAGLCQSLGKLSLDACIQRDVGEHVRTSMFARSETLLQLGWVIGGLIGVGLYTLDATVRTGVMVVAAILVVWLLVVVSRMRADRRGDRPAVAPDPPRTAELP